MRLAVMVVMALVLSVEGLEFKKRDRANADLMNREKRATESGVLDLLFQFGDSNKDDRLDEKEVRSLFCGQLFASQVNDIVIALMSRDSDQSNSLDLNEWRSIVFSEAELQTFRNSPMFNILA
ncbi:uncharacterized protein LOC133181550 [Saccostrea echinata]|uniref:uncharacterized protein LOC133181550 n=1 Tax=Saccostrea echinata TaxID=191078 RepID=UPI002A824B22|nr:uncharacterized protein LOC133181550 [Saccostrea echinata]